MTTGFDDNLDELAEAESYEWSFASRLEEAVKAERDRVLAAIEAAFPEFWAFEGDEEALRVVIAKLREVVS